MRDVLVFIIIATLVALGLASLIVDDARSASRPDPQRAVRDLDIISIPNHAFFIAIGQCEQPASDEHFVDGEWETGYEYGVDWAHPGSTYPGGLGVWYGLWDEAGISGAAYGATAADATPADQMRHAQKIVDRYGAYAWGCAGRALDHAQLTT